MSVKIENLTNRPVLLRLNSGQTLHLAPSTTSIEIMDTEVKSNSKVQKLQERRVITLHPVGKKEPPPAEFKKERTESPKGKAERLSTKGDR